VRAPAGATAAATVWLHNTTDEPASAVLLLTVLTAHDGPTVPGAAGRFDPAEARIAPGASVAARLPVDLGGVGPGRLPGPRPARGRPARGRPAAAAGGHRDRRGAAVRTRVGLEEVEATLARYSRLTREAMERHLEGRLPARHLYDLVRDYPPGPARGSARRCCWRPARRSAGRWTRL
jgi:hypothetical protein